METCSICQKPYQEWTPSPTLLKHNPQLRQSLPLIIPACDCLKLKAEREYEKHRAEEGSLRSSEKFSLLGLGPIDDLLGMDLKVPLGAWADPAKAMRDGNNLVLIGTSGTGKTSLVKQLAWKLINEGYAVRGGYAPGLMSDFKDMSKVEEMYSQLVSAEVLVLDDLDKIMGTQYEIERILSLVDRATARHSPIMVTMNVEFSKLSKDLMGGRYALSEAWVGSLVSRIRNNAEIIHLQGRDHRTPASSR